MGSAISGPWAVAPSAGDAQPLDPALALALADEMVALTVRLSDLAYELGAAPETLRRHMESLQAVDEITQRQLAIADVLRSREPVPDRLAAITLTALGDTLSQAYHQHAAQAG